MIVSLVGVNELTVSEGIDGDKHMANVCLQSYSALQYQLYVQPRARPTYIDFCILEPFFQIVVYSLV